MVAISESVDRLKMIEALGEAVEPIKQGDLGLADHRSTVGRCGDRSGPG
jgi:hypothetical protein